MKLLLYEKFMESFIQLNRTTQKKVLEFQRKFRENSKSAAIHLEPISDFRDPSLRTARIDQKYRAVIKVLGDEHYYLLWVDNHDEAMDWARNKRFDWNERTNAMQVFSDERIVEAEQKRYAPDPSVSMELPLNAYIDDELESIGVPIALLPAVRQINGLEGLESLEKHLPPDAFENLFNLLDGSPIDRIIEEVREGAEGGGSMSSNNARSFIEVLDDQVLEAALNGSFDKWRYFLHPSQRLLVAGDFKGSVKVSGGAGTGKTVAALHRLKHLSEVKSDSRPILFTTYTKNLTSHLAELVQSMGVPSSKVKVTNFDKLTFELGQQEGIIQTGAAVWFSDSKTYQDLWDRVAQESASVWGATWLRLEFEQIVLLHDVTDEAAYLRVPRVGRGKAIGRRMRMEVWALMQRFMELKGANWHLDELKNAISRHFTQSISHRPFSHAVVDELQDLSNIDLRLVRSLVDEGPNDLMLVGDPMQSIYNRRIHFGRFGIHIRGKRSKRLRINYRTTEEIKRVALSVISEITFDDFDGGEESKAGYVSLVRGVRPIYHVFQRKQEEMDFILQSISSRIASGQALASEIAIGCRLSDDLNTIVSALHKADIPYYKMVQDRRVGDKSGVVLLTLHGLKGLEFKHVYLCCVNADTAPFDLRFTADLDDPEALTNLEKSERSLYYVAASRAIISLTLTGSGRASKWFESLRA